MKPNLLIGLCRLNGRLRGASYRHSRPVEGNAVCMGLGEKLWWGYKYFVRPVEEPQPGQGIEEFFGGQDLCFRYGDDFVETAGLDLAAGGDLLVSQHIRADDTDHLWDDVRRFYFGADIVYANLETPIVASRPPSFVPADILKAPPLNGSPEVFERVVDGGRGVNLFSTANNHCLDQGEDGLRETLDFLDARGYPHVGTSRSPAERDAVVMLERRGVKVAFLSYTFSLNDQALPEGKDYLANYIRLNSPDVDLSPIRRQVEAARRSGADAVVAFVHWSLEFEAFPVRSVIDAGHRLVELGIDAVIGNHPHNVQPIEAYECADPSTGRPRRGLIVYALGDLLSVHSGVPNSRLGNLVKLRISKGRLGGAECVRITSFEALPTFLYARMRDDRCEEYRVLDFQKLVGALAAGSNPLGLGQQEIAELRRLDGLLHRLLGPALSARGSDGPKPR